MLRNLWRNSVGFRRVVAALALGLAVLAVYLGSNIPEAVTLPDEALDKLATAHTTEHLRIFKPRLRAGGPILSFEGAANVNAEVWAESAMLTGSSVRFAALAPAEAVRTVYSQGGQEAGKASKDCRTMLTVSRKEPGGAPPLVELWQSGDESDQQTYREVIVSSPQEPLVLEVSTNAPPQQPGAICPRLLTMGETAIPIPAGPVDLLVPRNKTIKLLFSATDENAAQGFRRGTFDHLSLGAGTLKANGLDVAAAKGTDPPLLHVVAHSGTEGITLHDLKVGAEAVSVSVGQTTEKADAWTSGKRMVVFDLVDKIQKNPVLGYLLAAVIIPGLWVWIRKTCFPPKPKARRRRTLPKAEEANK